MELPSATPLKLIWLLTSLLFVSSRELLLTMCVESGGSPPRLAASFVARSIFLTLVPETTTTRASVSAQMGLPAPSTSTWSSKLPPAVTW